MENFSIRSTSKKDLFVCCLHEIEMNNKFGNLLVRWIVSFSSPTLISCSFVRFFFLIEHFHFRTAIAALVAFVPLANERAFPTKPIEFPFSKSIKCFLVGISCYLAIPFIPRMYYVRCFIFFSLVLGAILRACEESWSATFCVPFCTFISIYIRITRSEKFFPLSQIPIPPLHQMYYKLCLSPKRYGNEMRWDETICSLVACFTDFWLFNSNREFHKLYNIFKVYRFVRFAQKPKLQKREVNIFIAMDFFFVYVRVWMCADDPQNMAHWCVFEIFSAHRKKTTWILFEQSVQMAMRIFF